jgi:23S rRNA pseudouridine1911/1915/1917 synthase
MKKIIIKTNDNLINYLRNSGFSKNNVKTLVRLKKIYVNDKLISKLPYDVKIGDIIIIKDNKISNDIDIVYEDNNYLIVNKEPGLLTISTTKKNRIIEDTLYKRVRNYLNKRGKYAFIVNRIDKDTSGLVIFVKNEKLKNKLQNNWNKIVKTRKYMAVVSGEIKKEGRIDNYLYEDKMTFSHSTTIGGKRAITNYVPKYKNNKYTLLDINIETGRKNQIRVHMSEMNHPIVGDKKYYSKDNRFKRLMLHHYEISLIDPISHKLLVFKSEVPCEFYSLFKNN